MWSGIEENLLKKLQGLPKKFQNKKEVKKFPNAPVIVCLLLLTGFYNVSNDNDAFLFICLQLSFLKNVFFVQKACPLLWEAVQHIKPHCSLTLKKMSLNKSLCWIIQIYFSLIPIVPYQK